LQTKPDQNVFMVPEIDIRDYHYPLTDEKIAKYPLAQRDASKLLVYGKDGRNTLEESIFRTIPSYLPKDALMIFNDTKVVPARLFFRRESGAKIEIFLLKPVSPVEYNTSFAATDRCSWMCVSKNAQRWKDDLLVLDLPSNTEPSSPAPTTAQPAPETNYEQPTSPSQPDHSELSSCNLRARLLERNGETMNVEFSWDGAAPFSKVLELCGRVPIPPYLNRETEAIDVERYQTMYAKFRGSVAAPTAGLHFTEEVLSAIRNKGIETDNVCLHVGAGTFLPVKNNYVSKHVMHREPIAIRRQLLEKLIQKLNTGRPLIAVGTTSVRSLESLYYIGAGILETGAPQTLEQWVPYEKDYRCTTQEALQAIIDYLDREGLEELHVETRIIIVPGFRFRLVDVLVTNFHQPESTLILLVSAFVAGDWRRIYDYAIDNNFRFLSYGDSSLLFRKDYE